MSLCSRYILRFLALQIKLYQMIEDTSFLATSLPSDLDLAIKHPLDQVLGTVADIVWYRSGRQSQRGLVIGIDTDVILSGKHWLAHQPTIKRPQQPGGVYCVDPHNLHLIAFYLLLSQLLNISPDLEFPIPKPLTSHYSYCAQYWQMR